VSCLAVCVCGKAFPVPVKLALACHPPVPQNSDLYWMVTNLNRDSTRSWKQPSASSSVNPPLHIPRFSKCEVDRSAIALYFSR
jgi:hypothetical protein